MKATSTTARTIFASALCLMLTVMLSSFASRAQQKETPPKPFNPGTQTQPQSPSKIPLPNKIPLPTKTPPVVQLPGQISTNVPGLRGGNWDFEHGNLQGWTMTGTAFASQPTFENNVEVRRPGTGPNHQGRYWIGTFENRPNAATPLGSTQGDTPQGTLVSVKFRLNFPYIRFRVGGGSLARGVRVELRTDDPDTPLIAQSAGNDDERMRVVTWDVRNYNGVEAYIQIVDASSGAWGHINVDDFQFDSGAPGAEVFRNWDFEDFGRGLRDWTLTGNAFARQPTFGDNVSTVRVNRQLVPLGGDYWKGPYPIGVQGRYWIGTYEDRPTPGDVWSTTKNDAPKGTMTSVEFAINQRFISFLVGGGSLARGERVELLVRVEDFERLQAAQPRVDNPLGGTQTTRLPFVRREGESVIVYQAGGQDSELMRRVSWDVSQLKSAVAQIRVVDSSDGEWGHINVDDFRFTAAEPPAVAVPVWGFADTHAHPTAQLGFGGLLYWGESTDSYETALPHCEPAHGIGGTGLPTLWAGARILSEGLGLLTGGGISNESILQLSVNAIEGKGGHLVGGYPEFDGWPRFDTKLHQHMHEEWIKRAYQGGLRLMVAHAVNNEMLANIKPKNATHPVDDKAVADLQIEAIKQLARRNSTWMEIAYTPAQAREIINNNKLALVLGVEVDSLGNWRRDTDCTDEEVRAELARLYALGVRHIFPVHFADNAFGSPSIYGDFFNFNNHTLRNEFYRVRSGQDRRGQGYEVEFRLMEDFPAADAQTWTDIRQNLRSRNMETLRMPRRNINLRQMVDDAENAKREYDRLPSHMNARGLTARGRNAVEEMMNLGMIIETDHLSGLATNEVLEMSANRERGGTRGYPLASGHPTFRELRWRRGETTDRHKVAHEGDKTPEEVERIRNLGGIVGPITTGVDVRPWGTDVPDDAPGSSKSWAQAYLYAIDKMNGRGVGIGTDMALLGGLGPRFGSMAANGLIDETGVSRVGTASDLMARRSLAFGQRNGVRYRTPIRNVRSYRWDIRSGDVYTGEERDFWAAITLGRSDIDIDGVDFGPNEKGGFRAPGLIAYMKDVAKGVRAAATGQALESLPEPNPTTNNVLGLYNYAALQRAAWHAYHDTPSAEIGNEGIRRDADKLRPIAGNIKQMDGTNPPLERIQVGQHDFDFNLDGFAHYGMLPDLLQDVRNVGVSQEKLGILFRSAEDYIQMWEKCARMRTRP